MDALIARESRPAFMEPEEADSSLAEEPGAGTGGIRAGVGRRRRGDGEPGRISGAIADPRTRHSGTSGALQEAGSSAQAGENRKPWRGAFALTERFRMWAWTREC